MNLIRFIFSISLAILLSACSSTLPNYPLQEPMIKRLGERLVFIGSITRSSAKIFATQVASNEITTLVIKSSGGDVEAAMDMAELIAQKEMDIEVHGICASACANYLFPAARRKIITQGAVVLWHGNAAHLTYLDKIKPDRSTEQHKLAALRTAKREAEFFKRIGVDEFICWFGKLAPYKIRGAYALSKQDMEYFGMKNIEAPDDYTSTDLESLNKPGREHFEFTKLTTH